MDIPFPPAPRKTPHDYLLSEKDLNMLFIPSSRREGACTADIFFYNLGHLSP